MSWPKPPEPEPEPEAEPELDPDGVNEWRYDALKAAGWPDIYAVLLAIDHTVDLHQACGLLEHGCPVGRAWEILY